MGAKGARRSMGTKGAQRKFLSLCTPTLSSNPTLTPMPTATLSLVLTLHLPLPLPRTLTLALTLTRIEYWDRAGGGRNIV